MRNLNIEEKESIKNFIVNHNIKKLYHFTRIENLPSILQHGILPVQKLQRNGMGYYYNDIKRYDGCSNASCLSISFPNYKMFFHLRFKNQESNWAVLELDARILYELDCAFCRSNAARRDISRQPLYMRKGVSALAKMFDEQEYMRNGIPAKYPTDPQAEVLAFAEIPTEYIKCVYTDTMENCNYIKSLKPNVMYGINRNYFAPRSDYKRFLKVA